MTVSIKSPTSTTGSIQLNGSDVLTIESDNSVDIDSGTLHVDATNNRVGVGTSSPATNLDISGTGSKEIRITSNTSGNSRLGFNVAGSVYAYWEVDRASGAMIYSNGTERMRIDSSGNLLVGVTSGGSILYGASIENTLSSGPRTKLTIGHTVGGTGTDYIVFRYNGTNIGSITQSGTTNVAYNTSSDYRLKENVAPMSGSIDRLKQLKPSTWSWTQDGSHGEGFLAHEAQEVVPESVHGTKDAIQIWKEGEELPEGVSVGDNKLDENGNTIPEYQGIDQSKLVPLLTAALQEAITKIEDLETRIQTLESA